MGVKTRIAIGALAFSAAGFVALTADEGFIPSGWARQSRRLLP